MCTLAHQDRPGSALPEVDERTPIFSLAIPVMVVATPARTVRRFDFEDFVDHLQRFHHQRIVRPPNAIPDQFQEPAIDHLARLKRVLLPRRAVGNVDLPRRNLRVVKRFTISWRTDPHVVVRHLRIQHPAPRGGPLIQVRLDPVGVVLQKAAQLSRTVVPHDLARAQQRRDHHRQRGRRVARVFLPALLLRHRRIAHQKARRPRHKGADIEVAQPVQLPQTPGQDHRKRDLIQLNARPVRRPIDPEILRKAAVRVLRAGQVHQRAACGVNAAAGQQRRRRLHHVTRPHQVVPAQIVIGLGIAPRNRSRSDKGAGVRLVLMRQNDVVRNARQPAAVARYRGQSLRAQRTVPLLDEPFPVHLIRCGEGLHHAGKRGMTTFAQGNRDCELAEARHIDLAHYGDVAVQRRAIVPAHL